MNKISSKHVTEVEDIISTLREDVNALKNRSLQEACSKAYGLLQHSTENGKFYQSFQIRDAYFLPFRMALESRCNKLVNLAISGLQNMLTDERFHSNEDIIEKVELQLPTQFLEAISTVSLQSEDVQMEIMKLLQNVLKRYSTKIHGNHLVKFAEVCIETFWKSNLSSTKTSCQTTLKKLLSSVCDGFKGILIEERATHHRDSVIMETDTSKLLRQDIICLLKHLCVQFHHENGDLPHQQQNDELTTLCLESIQFLLSNLTTCIQQDKDFVSVVRQVLCPALIQLLGSPLIETKAKTMRSNLSLTEESRTTVANYSAKHTSNPHIAQTIFAIAGELVRLVGNLKILRPTLESLFRQILQCSQASDRMEALKLLKEILGNPQRIFNLAGPTSDQEPGLLPPIESRKTDLDLFLLVIEGIQESSQQKDISVSIASVSCVVALLTTLEDLSNGRGFCDEYIEVLKNIKDDVLCEEDNLLSLACSNLDSENEDEERPTKPKHIRWLMDYEEQTKSDEEEAIIPKTVSWAEHHEERFIDYRDSSQKLSVDKNKPFIIKSRTDSGLKFHSKNKKESVSPQRLLVRSQSVTDLRCNERGFPLRKVSSTSKLEVVENFMEPIKVNVTSLKRFHKSNSKRQKIPIMNEENKSPKPILRKFRSFPDATQKGPTQEPIKSAQIGKDKNHQHIENTSPSKETTINGIPLSKLPRKKRNSRFGVKKKSKTKSPSSNNSHIESANKSKVITDPPTKTVEELEKEGARNFARCLLGILPSVLAATEPSVVDDLLQQFASDVCEAVTCLALKRKHVPNFGTVRSFEKKSEGLEKSEPSNDPTLNADGVYKAVYETLKLNYQLSTSGYYKKPGSFPHISQNEFIQSVINFNFPVRLSRVWLGEVYRLVTTYDILSKAGYKSHESTRTLIGILSEKLYTQRLSRSKDVGDSECNAEMTTGRKEGMGFAKRLLKAAWEQVLNTLVLPVDSTNETISNTSITKATISGDGSDAVNIKSSLERDMVCLTLDGLRRAARLCCDLGIQSGCDLILSRLSQASCSFLNDEVRHQSRNGMMLSIRLHASHVLSMDALFAVGLELGSLAPKAWSHVFQGCMHISTLEQASFVDIDCASSYVPVPLPLNSTTPNFYASSINSNDSLSPDSTNSFSPITERHRSNVSFTSSGFLPPEDACRAVYALSNAVDNLFDMAATALPLKALKEFLASLVDSSSEQLFRKEVKIDPERISQEHLLSMNTLYLYHICDVMLRCARNNTRPLLHVMEAWSVISSHLIEAAYSKDSRISKVALTSIHDVMSELLKRRNELPHFWFYNVIFKPFEVLMGVHSCDVDLQDQILYILVELVEEFAPSIKSGWRTIFASLIQAHIYTPFSTKFVDDSGERRRKMVLNIADHFVQLKTTNMFAGGAVSCVLCLLKFIRKTPRDHLSSNDDLYESRGGESMEDVRSVGGSDDYHNESTESRGCDDLCETCLNLLLQISKRLSSIYIQPSSTIFFGSYDIVLANMSESQDKVWDDTWSCSSNNTSNEGASNDTKTSNTATSIIAIDETGILRIWFLILEGLTSSVTKCPKNYQPMIIELLFEVMNSITTVPGPHFSMFVISNLLLPMLKTWLNQGYQKQNYWDSTFHDFKHACGLATQLIVEEMADFLKVEGAEDCVPVMLEQLLDLFHDCISQPLEVIARLGCSCLRHLLLSAGPQFTEELWNILCNGIKHILNSTLSQVRQLLACFQSGSNSVTGDNGTTVKIVARRDVTPSEALRALQLAEQVFLLESQVSEEALRLESDLDDDDIRSYVFVIMLSGHDATSPTKIRIPFRSLTVSLLSNQILVQMLGSILLESADSVHGPIISTITDAGLLKRNNKESSLPGLLNYLSSNNLNSLFDCLLDAHNVAHEFNTRPGLRCLTQKLARLETRANLFRTSLTSFAFYLNTLFQISKYDGEHFSISNIKRILTGEKVMLDPVSPETPVKVTENKTELLKNSEEIDWIIRRLHEACNQITNMYQKLHQSQSFKEQDSGFIEAMSRSFSSLESSPKRQSSDMSEENIYTSKLMKGVYLGSASSTKNFHSSFRNSKRNIEEEKTALQTLKKKEDDILHLSAWSQLIISMLDLLLSLPILQFKSVLPAVFPSVTSLITTVQDPKIRQLVCDVIRRSGSIYGII